MSSWRVSRGLLCDHDGSRHAACIAAPSEWYAKASTAERKHSAQRSALGRHPLEQVKVRAWHSTACRHSTAQQSTLGSHPLEQAKVAGAGAGAHEGVSVSQLVEHRCMGCCLGRVGVSLHSVH